MLIPLQFIDKIFNYEVSEATFELADETIDSSEVILYSSS